MTPQTESRGTSVSRTAAAEALRQRLATPFPPTAAAAAAAAPTTDDTDSTKPDEPTVGGERASAATLGHVLTNVVILYEFVLELSAVVQVRASLFEEAGY
jgi:hypothetical protein